MDRGRRSRWAPRTRTCRRLSEPRSAGCLLPGPANCTTLSPVFVQGRLVHTASGPISNLARRRSRRRRPTRRAGLRRHAQRGAPARCIPARATGRADRRVMAAGGADAAQRAGSLGSLSRERGDLPSTARMNEQAEFRLRPHCSGPRLLERGVRFVAALLRAPAPRRSRPCSTGRPQDAQGRHGTHCPILDQPTAALIHGTSSRAACSTKRWCSGRRRFGRIAHAPGHQPGPRPHPFGFTVVDGRRRRKRRHIYGVDRRFRLPSPPSTSAQSTTSPRRCALTGAGPRWPIVITTRQPRRLTDVHGQVIGRSSRDSNESCKKSLACVRAGVG